MSDLSPLEQELGAAIGLAQIAEQATAKVAEMVEKPPPREMLCRLREESAEIARRAVVAAENRDGDTEGILRQAAETRDEGVTSMRERLGEGSSWVDGLDFLIELKVREAARWAALRKLNEEVRDLVVGELTEWALRLEWDHLGDLRDASLDLDERDDR